MISLRTAMGAAALAMLASGCTGNGGGAAGSGAAAEDVGPPPAERLAAGLWTGTGANAGLASAEEVPGGVRVSVNAEGLTPGPHGVHVHTVGKCEAPDFASAGGHWNPGAKQHGALNPMGPHAGDMPNLIAGADGRGTLSFLLPGATLAALTEGDGSALVVHAGEDDLKTDPSGNSGGRVACGVLESAN
ncbi:MAG: superoxide dismutase family protein [Sphingomonas sp.]